MQSDFQFCIIGGGAVGLAIATQLSQQGSVILLERHTLLGSETSSRNSEVIHAGLYYPPGSLKERLCLRGKHLLYQYCQEHQIPHRALGKLIVAQRCNDPALAALEQKAKQLNIPIERLNRQQLRQREPNVQGAEALFSPTTGIIDSHAYMQALEHQAQRQGALIMCRSEFISAAHRDGLWQVTINSDDGIFSFDCNRMINCAGLAAQQVALNMGHPAKATPALHPCRGHYFSYHDHCPFNHLIYPLPEANLAGLGIHATIDLNNQLRFGPDTQYLSGDNLSYNVDAALKEKFTYAIRQYFPALDENRLHADYAGIRPKLHRQQEPAADFQITVTEGATAVHLFGIESPGLTASLSIAEYVSQRAKM